MQFDELQQITVGVPMGRVPDFYEMFARWLREQQSGSSGAPVRDDKLKEFGAAPPSTVTQWWAELSAPAQRIFVFLADHPEERFDGSQLAASCAIEKGVAAVAGTLSWPGKHAAALGFALPFEWDRDQQKYWMTALVAGAIQTVRRSKKP